VSDDETFVLSRYPGLDDIVDATANPIPWRDWLPSETEVRDRSDVVVFHGYSNCNYLVYAGRVFQNFGYHGGNLFRTLSDPAMRAEFFARRKRDIIEIDSLLGRKS
jgi:hypothetical protein